ncbi:tetratricopeptide repeat protein [Thiohalophilus thiocyanatoxydans]|uniref:MSHA biogenesis protein MshN n=1 Tax=Thiohalophilus thiocyanatoxydans TaxID=381308 RepID=A0A4R8ISW9_9GAMM|nr:tetratricopeptide repeat protein [Thiohalophilus thiocyanatoxydans]TDY04076.1 MSHA biogenesis protein MshN [Thiohalophilus thiocyanatoxydans]
MSLINQMLKDLENRRAEAVESPDSPLKGVNRYNVARRGSPYLLYALGGLLLVLVALVGFLGWAYLNPPQPGASTPPVAAAMPAPAEAPQTPPGSDTPPVKTPLVKAEPEPRSEPEPESRSEPEPRSEPKPEPEPEPKSEPEPEPKSEPEPEPKSEPKSEPEPESGVTARAPASPGPAKQKTEEPAVSATQAGQDDGPVNKRDRPMSDEQRAELAYKKGYQRVSRDQREAGERYLREALAHYRRHHGARELLASLYIKSGRYVEAGTLLKEGLALAPGHALFAKLYARVMLQQEKPNQAIAILEQQPPMPGVDSEYHALLAALYQRTDQHLKAAATYRDILRVNPRQGSWWIGLGISLEQLEKYNEARAAYQRAKDRTQLTENLKEYVDKRLAVLANAGG